MLLLDRVKEKIMVIINFWMKWSKKICDKYSIVFTMDNHNFFLSLITFANKDSFAIDNNSLKNLTLSFLDLFVIFAHVVQYDWVFKFRTGLKWPVLSAGEN